MIPFPTENDICCVHMLGKLVRENVGFYPLQRVKNGQVQLFGVLYKKNKSDQVGLMVNFCPWCGRKKAIQEEKEVQN